MSELLERGGVVRQRSKGEEQEEGLVSTYVR